MSTDVEAIIRIVQALPPDQQNRVRQALDASSAIPCTKEESKMEDEFKRRLVMVGLIKDVKPPVTDFETYRVRIPFDPQGKPLSQTILEERR